MTPLELMLTGERRPSELFGTGYDGPPKPSDWGTALYTAAYLAAMSMVSWITFF